MAKSKRERFLSTAELRVNAVINDLRKLGNCAAPETYEYTDDEVRQIIKAVDAEVANLKAKFAGNDRFRLVRSEDENHD